MSPNRVPKGSAEKEGHKSHWAISGLLLFLVVISFALLRTSSIRSPHNVGPDSNVRKSTEPPTEAPIELPPAAVTPAQPNSSPDFPNEGAQDLRRRSGEGINLPSRSYGDAPPGSGGGGGGGGDVVYGGGGANFPSSLPFEDAYNNQFKALKDGQLATNVPSDITVGDEWKDVVVELTRAKPNTLPLPKMPAGGSISLDRVPQVGPFMTVKIANPDQHLEIKALSPEDQFVAENSYTPWQYKVRGVKHGKAELAISVGFRLKSPNGEERTFQPTFEKFILVNVSYQYAVKEFVTTNWQFFITALILPLIGAPIAVWWKRRQDRLEKERQKEEEPKIIIPKDDDIPKLKLGA